MASTTKPFIRPYDSSKDSNFVFRVCQKTAAPGLLKEPAILIAPYIWCVPYVRLCPDHCFVVDDGQGNAVGYIICAPDTPEYVQKYKEEYIPVLEDLDPLLKKPQMEPPADWGTDLPTAFQTF
ncbi:hypothetical protein M407DRAFT_31155 [Tulasnella calospora MUT 4182]|uniref:Uncharacterized protein n=1 Tax=Tulasnella calospora MUT 4182 TaxID=1051891 RepID=A0A0C3LCI9_9AGAM|nr:hypothetical protein M407DRAFT_31155 [Tulasnella calospora MUT 4182]